MFQKSFYVCRPRHVNGEGWMVRVYRTEDKYRFDTIGLTYREAIAVFHEWSSNSYVADTFETL